MQRNLSAVLAADVVGYSRMMGDDANKTLAALRRLRAELFAPAVAGHRGKLVKSMGDGWIVTFASAVDAVTCAMRLQDKMVVGTGHRFAHWHPYRRHHPRGRRRVRRRGERGRTA